MANITLTIGPDTYDFDGRVSAQLNGRNKSTLKLDGVYNKVSSTSRNILTFPLYTKVNIKEFNSNEINFSGVIKESTPTQISNKYEIKPAKIQVYDYGEFLTNGVLLSKVFIKTTPQGVIDWLQTKLVNLNGIKFTIQVNHFGIPDMVINQWVIQDGTPYDILNEFCDRTNSRFWIGYQEPTIYLDAWDKMIESPTANLTFKIEPAVIWTNDISELIQISYEDSSSFGYANTVIVRSPNLIGSESFIQTFQVRAGQISFNTNYKIGEIINIWLYDSETDTWRQLFVRESEWAESPYNQWYEIKWTQKQTLLEYNENIDQLKNGQTLYVEYSSIDRGASVQTNDAEIERVMNASGYGNGQIVYVEEKDDITSQTDLDNYCLSILNKMSTPRKDYMIETGVSQQWKISEIILINNEPYIVNSIEWDHLYIKDGPVVSHFTYFLTSTKNDKQKINFYDNRLKTSQDEDVIQLEEVINAQLTLHVADWQETTDEYGYLPIQIKDDYTVWLYNGITPVGIFKEQNLKLEQGKSYELEVILDGEQLEWKVY